MLLHFDKISKRNFNGKLKDFSSKKSNNCVRITTFASKHFDRGVYHKNRKKAKVQNLFQYTMTLRHFTLAGMYPS